MDDVLPQLRLSLADRYEVQQELGQGGMAVVYLARDLRHDRKVAIKVLRQDVGGASAERFLREIRTVAALHHPHILQLLDSGTAGDHLFYVMPYVEGETLRQRLEREGPLGVDEAVRIAREVADALGFAHGRGIVHRDVKPENIFLSAGHALVADFGIARATESAAAGTTLTDVGLAVGTPTYMSPEQATAEPKIDGRSDQYALGCVLYEMLAGAPPFTGPTSQAIMARHTADPVPPLRTVRDVSPALESAITKALAKVPADRWPSIDTFSDSLGAASRDRASETRATSAIGRWQRVAFFGAVPAAVLLAFVAYASRTPGGAPEVAAINSIRSVALRPFSFSGDTAFRWVAETFADGLVPGLVKVPGVSVKPPAQTRVDLTAADDPAEVGRMLKVDAVLTGDILVRGNLLRVTARLLNVADGAVRWQGSLNGELDVEGAPRDFYRITDSLALQIISALRPELSAESRAVAERGVRTTNLEALALYQRARLEAGVSRTPASWVRAKELLERALELDSSFADAMLLLHEATVSSMIGSGQTPARIVAAVDGLLDRAIRIDSMNGLAWAVRGRYRAAFKWEWEASNADYRRAVALSPSSPDVLWEYAWSLNERDQRDSAAFYGRRAFALTETNALSLHDLSVVLYFAGRADSALDAARVGLTLEPGWTNYFVPMNALLDRGQRAEADSMAAKYLNLGGYCCTQALSYAAGYFLRSGNRERAQEMLDSMHAHARRGTVPGSELAAAYLAVGNRAKALDELERSHREHDPMLPNNLWSLLSPLAGEPRYESVFRSVFGNQPARRSVQ